MPVPTKFAPQRANRRDGRYTYTRTALPLGIFLLVLLFAGACAAQEDVSPTERRVHRINETIMCPVCPGESIDQSQNALAVQMRGVVREKVEEGWTDQQIKDFFVERYGPSVLLKPPQEGFSLLVWVLPPVGVAGAGAVLFLALRWMRRPQGSDEEANLRENDLSEEELSNYMRRIESALDSEAHTHGMRRTGAGPADEGEKE